MDEQTPVSGEASLELIGEVEFSKRGNLLFALVIPLLFISLTGTVVFLWSIGRPLPEAFEILPVAGPWLFGFVFLMILAVMVSVVVSNAGTVLICHEKGLRLREGRRWQEVLFEDVIETCWGDPRRPSDQTTFSLIDRHGHQYHHAPLGGGKADRHLLRLRDILSECVAHNQGLRIQSGDTVPWSFHGAIHADGLFFSRKRFIGPAEKLYLGWDELQIRLMSNGNAEVRSLATTSRVLKVDWRGPNFHSGLRLIERLQQSSGI